LRQARAVYEALRKSNNMKSRDHSSGAILLVAGFLYRHYPVAHLGPGARMAADAVRGRLWSEPASAKPPDFGRRAEQYRDLLRMPRDATVNITSVVYREDWFFRVVPGGRNRLGGYYQTHRRDPHQNHVVSGGAARADISPSTLADKKVTRRKSWERTRATIWP